MPLHAIPSHHFPSLCNFIRPFPLPTSPVNEAGYENRRKWIPKLQHFTHVATKKKSDPTIPTVPSPKINHPHNTHHINFPPNSPPLSKPFAFYSILLIFNLTRQFPLFASLIIPPRLLKIRRRSPLPKHAHLLDRRPDGRSQHFGFTFVFVCKRWEGAAEGGRRRERGGLIGLIVFFLVVVFLVFVFFVFVLLCIIFLFIIFLFVFFFIIIIFLTIFFFLIFFVFGFLVFVFVVC